MLFTFNILQLLSLNTAALFICEILVITEEESSQLYSFTVCVTWYVNMYPCGEEAQHLDMFDKERH